MLGIVLEQDAEAAEQLQDAVDAVERNAPAWLQQPKAPRPLTLVS